MRIMRGIRQRAGDALDLTSSSKYMSNVAATLVMPWQ